MATNVLLITADQLRADALGCYGNTFCQTPHLDAIAGRGVLFRNSFTPDPICVPARATITTGNYPHKATGIKNNGGCILDGQPKIAAHFAQNGYRSYACGKLHYVPYSAPGEPRLVHGFDTWDSAESGRILAMYDPQGNKRGVEDYFDYLADVGWAGYSRAHGIGNNDVRPCPTPLPQEHHVDHWVADRTIQRLRDHKNDHGDKPFFMWSSFPKPHAPLDPPYEYAQMYNPRELPPPAGDASYLSDRCPNLERERARRGLVGLSPQALQVIKAYYYGIISFQDHQIGRIVSVLEELGMADNTVIVYTADHGDLMGDFGAFFKCSFLEGSVRVPIIFAGPGISQGVVRDDLVGLQDILPTVCNLSGSTLNDSVDGRDVSDALASTSASSSVPSSREVYYAQCLDDPTQLAMVTDGRWKYCYSQEGAVEELYDLVNDPRELVNLAATGDHASQVAHWRDVLIQNARQLGDTDILDDNSPNGLVSTPVDRRAIRELPIHGMGWRWY